MFTELTEDHLDQLLANNPKVMVQYGATWCGNCKITKPKFKRMAEENEGIEFTTSMQKNFQILDNLRM